MLESLLNNFAGVRPATLLNSNSGVFLWKSRNFFTPVLTQDLSRLLLLNVIILKWLLNTVDNLFSIDCINTQTLDGTCHEIEKVQFLMYLMILTGESCFTQFSAIIYWNRSLCASDIFHISSQWIKFNTFHCQILKSTDTSTR